MEQPKYSEIPEPMRQEKAATPAGPTSREVIIIGGGIAGLSAAIYLGRALRDVLVIDSGESLALWEPEVQNYLGFPRGIHGKQLLNLGREQAGRFGAEFVCDEVETASQTSDAFELKGKKSHYSARKILLATGVYHLPPKIPKSDECIGKSMFFCKDCDGYRVQKKRVAIVGANNEAVRYALGLMTYTDQVTVLTNGEKPRWNKENSKTLERFKVPVLENKIVDVVHEKGCVRELHFENRICIELDCLFTTRGDLFRNDLARQLGARVDDEGQVVVDKDQHTSVPGLYAAGCVTTANCQMIIAAGNGATAAQAINCDLLNEYLDSGELLNDRATQFRYSSVKPDIRLKKS